MTDIRQTSLYGLYLTHLSWQVIKKERVFYFVKYIPLFRIIKVQRPAEINFKTLEELSRKKGFTQIIFEPKNQTQAEQLERKHFKKITPYLPSKTVVLDLNPEEKEILKKMKKDCRRAIEKTQKLTVKECSIADLKEFRQEWKKTVNFKRFVPPLSQLEALKRIFKNNSLFLLYQQKTSFKEKATAGAVFLKGDKTAYYWQAFTDKEGRRKLAQYQLVWQGILWAKKNGCRQFDFEGIFDPRFPNRNWLGFSHFKKSFGGKEIIYPGCYTQTRWHFNLHFQIFGEQKSLNSH